MVVGDGEAGELNTYFQGHHIWSKGRRLSWRRPKTVTNNELDFLELPSEILAVFPFRGALLAIGDEGEIFRVAGWETWDSNPPYSGLVVAGIGRMEIW